MNSRLAAAANFWRKPRYNFATLLAPDRDELEGPGQPSRGRYVFSCTWLDMTKRVEESTAWSITRTGVRFSALNRAGQSDRPPALNYACRRGPSTATFAVTHRDAR